MENGEWRRALVLVTTSFGLFVKSLPRFCLVLFFTIFLLFSLFSCLSLKPCPVTCPSYFPFIPFWVSLHGPLSIFFSNCPPSLFLRFSFFKRPPLLAATPKFPTRPGETRLVSSCRCGEEEGQGERKKGGRGVGESSVARPGHFIICFMFWVHKRKRGAFGSPNSKSA